MAVFVTVIMACYTAISCLFGIVILTLFLTTFFFFSFLTNIFFSKTVIKEECLHFMMLNIFAEYLLILYNLFDDLLLLSLFVLAIYILFILHCSIIVGFLSFFFSDIALVDPNRIVCKHMSSSISRFCLL